MSEEERPGQGLFEREAQGSQLRYYDQIESLWIYRPTDLLDEMPY